MYELLGLVLEGEEVLGGAAPAVAAEGGAGEHLGGAHLLSTLNTSGLHGGSVVNKGPNDWSY